MADDWLQVCVVPLWAVEVWNGLCKCLSTVCPTLGAKLLSQVFLSS